MNAVELIEILKDIKDAHGDIEVKVCFMGNKLDLCGIEHREFVQNKEYICIYILD